MRTAVGTKTPPVARRTRRAAVKLPFPLQDGERVILLTRRHWLYFVPRFIGYALAAIVPVVALLLGLAAAGQLHGTGLKAALVACAVWVLFWIVRVAVLKYRYDHDIWVVTNLRMVDYVAT